ncbi:MAG TPA: ribose-phosphate diphosphokinase [Steroidobacteraceae bacterium]|nr:ribose-phosphate diphosphokinase [Steroidobacteraceae bacterium]
MIPTLPGPALVALGESRDLAAAVAREAGLALIPIEERPFEGGEFKLRPLESVRGRRVFVLQTLAGTEDAPASSRLLRLLFLLMGLRDAGADSRVAVVPYFAFARKDRRTQIRDPVTSRYVAELLEAAHADGIIGLDVHNPAAFDNSFRVPTIHLTALPMLANHFALLGSVGSAGFAAVSPDVGGIKRAQIFRELMAARTGRDIDLAFIEKRRAKGSVSGGSLAGEVAGRTVIVLDDLCATGGTLIRAAETCRRAGAAAVHAAVTHTPLAAGLNVLLAAEPITSITVTDSVGIAFPRMHSPFNSGKLVTLSVAPLIGQALARIASGKPVAPLLESWPVPPDA